MIDFMLICFHSSPWWPVGIPGTSGTGFSYQLMAFQAVQHTVSLPRAKRYDSGPISLSGY